MDHISEREKRNIENLRASLSDCTVLLNYKGGFPLSEPGKIAAYGNGVRYTQKGGTGSGEVNSRYFLTVEQGLEEAGFTITTKTWLDAYDSVRQAEKVRQSEERKRKAKEEHINMMALAMGAVYREPEYDLPLEGEGDTAVYVLTRNAGEGNDRTLTKGDYLLTDTEVRDICALDERYPTFVLVLNTCGAVDLSPVAHVSNILSLSQLGVETGAILADILLGKSVPSGRLASSWPFAKDLPAIGNFGQTDDTDYREGIYVGYRYYDVMKKELRYPFGYGLSYTSFERTVHDVHIEGPCIFFRVRVANTGEYPGKEVVQVYLSAPWGRLGKAPRSLAAFAKTRLLQKGEEEDLVLSFDMRDNTSYDEASASRILEKGRYLVSVNEEKAFVLDLPEDKTIEKDRHAFGAPALPDFIPYKREPEIPEDLPVYLLDLSGVETFVPVYDQDPKIPELLKTLSDEELAYLGIGAFDPKSRFGSVIGEASSHVAGAAGESTSMLKEKGIRAMVFADGPAGLRLSKDYYEDEKGVHGLGGGIPESILEGMPAPIRFFLSRKSRLKKGTVIKHQYTTAIPTATAIAQSWNRDLARLCGDIVGGEMEEFGVDLWLAPSLNIHRHVLCGRNFEYYSEDPLLSGVFAAEITKGVQAHKGCGVTIKHFAANNQETNRYGSSSNVSERAMREIYLKGFEICVKEADPVSVMSSYNLINGVHTSERRDLITDILRSEWGFDGLVMTDWVVSVDFMRSGKRYPDPDPAKVIASGHSLFMPGGKKDHEQLLAGLKEGRVTRKDLEEAAAYLLRVIERLRG